MGWDVQPTYPRGEANFEQYKGALDISSGGTSMFAPDPVFFYTSSGNSYISLKQDWYDTSTPFFITNKGLSISLPVYQTASRWTGSFPSSLAPGQQPPLAILCLNGSQVDAGRDLWLTGIALFLQPSQESTMSYTRCWGADESGQTLFRGALLSFSIPSSLFKHHFRPTSMLVRAGFGCQSLFSWDQTPEVGVVVLNDAGTALSINAAAWDIRPGVFSVHDSRIRSPAQLRTGTSISGAIYRVTRYAEDTGRVEFQFYVLVRAAKRSRPAVVPGEGAKRESEDLFHWRCDLISRPPHELNLMGDYGLWIVGSTPLLLAEILELPMDGIDDGPIDDDSVLVRRKIRDKAIGKDVTVSICVNLTGRACWVTNPAASSIKFLHVTEERLGI